MWEEEERKGVIQLLCATGCSVITKVEEMKVPGECKTCHKTFKGQKGLKEHLTKSHDCNIETRKKTCGCAVKINS